MKFSAISLTGIAQWIKHLPATQAVRVQTQILPENFGAQILSVTLPHALSLPMPFNAITNVITVVVGGHCTKVTFVLYVLVGPGLILGFSTIFPRNFDVAEIYHQLSAAKSESGQSKKNLIVDQM